MPTYTYRIIATGETVEVEHGIKEKAWDVIEVDGEWKACERLISGAPGVHFVDGPSGGWSSTGYSKRPHERQAESILGRKLVKAAR